jgi:hypothetical protein
MRRATALADTSLHIEFEPVIYWFVNSCLKLNVRLVSPALATLLVCLEKERGPLKPCNKIS